MIMVDSYSWPLLIFIYWSYFINAMIVTFSVYDAIYINICN